MSGTQPAGVGPAGTSGGISVSADVVNVRRAEVIDIMRRIMAVLLPCTGTRASGSVTLTAQPGTTVQLPRGYYAYPVLDGHVHPELLLKTDVGPDDGDTWTVDDAGVAVTFISNVGGVRYNLPKNTPIHLDPPVPGIVSTTLPTVDALFTGGADLLGFGVIKDIVTYEQLDGPALDVDIRRSNLTRFPGVIITWEDLQPADGTTIAQTSRATRAGTRTNLYKSTYTISVISSRMDQDHERRHEGLALASAIADLLTDRQSVDGECLSNPSGMQIRNMFREAGPQDIYQKFYIYHILASAMLTLRQTDTRVFNELCLINMDVLKPQVPPLLNQGDFPLVGDGDLGPPAVQIDTKAGT